MASFGNSARVGYRHLETQTFRQKRFTKVLLIRHGERASSMSKTLTATVCVLCRSLKPGLKSSALPQDGSLTLLRYLSENVTYRPLRLGRAHRAPGGYCAV